MNILFLLRRADCHDGVASHVETLASGLKDLGHRVFIVSGSVSGKDTFQERYQNIRESVIEWFVDQKATDNGFSIRMLVTTFNVCKSNNINVIHTHGFTTLPVAKMVGSLLGIPIVSTLHPTSHFNSPKGAKSGESNSN